MRWIRRRRKRRGEKRADMRVSGDNEDRVRLRWMSREQEENKRRQKRGRHTQCEHIHAYTHTDKAQVKLMRSERNTQTQSQPYWRHLPIVYPRLRSLHRGPRRWELVVLFSWTSDVVVLATGGEDLFKDRLGMSRAAKPWETISTDWDFFFSLRGNSTGDMQNWVFKPHRAGLVNLWTVCV